VIKGRRCIGEPVRPEFGKVKMRLHRRNPVKFSLQGIAA
jgi:hypothetical protein